MEEWPVLYKIKNIVVNKGLLRGPFGGALKKEIFVPKSETAYKVYEQGCVLNKDPSVGNYYISEDYFMQKMKNFEVLPGDILVSCSGVNYGAIYRMPEKIEHGIINQALLRIRLDLTKVDPNYFCFLFENLISNIITASSGDSTIPNFPPLSSIKEIEINLPDIEEQRKIASFLLNYKEKIETNNKIIQSLTNKIKDIYSYCIENSFYCYKKKLSECAIIKTGKRDANYMNPKGQYKFYTCSEEEFKCDSYQFEGKNVLIAGNGSLYVKAVDEQFDAYQRTYVIKPKDETLFGSMFLSCAESLEILRRKSSGSIVKFIKINMIHDIDVYELNKDYLKIINTNLDLIIRLKQESEILNQYLETFSKELLSNTIIIE